MNARRRRRARLLTAEEEDLRAQAARARGRRLPRSVPWPRPSHSEYFARGTLKAPAADRRHSAVGSWSPDLSQLSSSPKCDLDVATPLAERVSIDPVSRSCVWRALHSLSLLLDDAFAGRCRPGPLVRAARDLCGPLSDHRPTATSRTHSDHRCNLYLHISLSRKMADRPEEWRRGKNPQVRQIAGYRKK